MMGDYLASLLEPHGYLCHTFESAKSFFLSNPTQARYCCLAISWDLPDSNAIDLIQQIKTWTTCPATIIISDAQHEEDLARALHLGADDFVTKPIKKYLFLARVTALLRRTERSQIPLTESVDLLTLHTKTLEVQTIAGEWITLTRQEFSVLECLLKNSGRLVSRKTLFDHFEHQTKGKSKSFNLNLTIFRLRKKLARLYGANIEIKSRYREGYRILLKKN
jgi:DNA-binding response OmpR family regulator